MEMVMRFFYDLTHSYNGDEKFPVPLASLRLKDVIEIIPLRLDEAPAIKFIQLTGKCGLSSFCSALYYCFDMVIARKWMESSDEFSIVTGEVTSLSRKKSSEVIYLL